MGTPDLSTAEMISIADDWIANRRAAFAASAKLEPYFEDLAPIRTALVASTPPPSPPPPGEVDALHGELHRLDPRHDSLHRGVLGTLEGVADAYAVKDPRFAAELRGVADGLYPHRLAFLNSSYAAEAGEAERFDMRLSDPAARHLLSLIKVRDEPLLGLAEEAVATGRTIGDRVRGLVVLDPAHAPAVRTEREARNRFLRFAGTLRRVAEDVFPPDAPASAAPLEGLFGFLDRTVQSATARRAPQEPQSPPGGGSPPPA